MNAPILIVTGAHLTAEIHHRPLAYALRDHLLRSLGEPAPDSVVVCSDLWYLNRDELREMPCISIGPPQVNALAAYLASRLPGVLVAEDRLMIQMSTEAVSPVASCWGVDEVHNARAVALFIERHLPEFLAALPAE